MFFYCISKYHVKFWIYMPIQHMYCTMKFFLWLITLIDYLLFSLSWFFYYAYAIWLFLYKMCNALIVFYWNFLTWFMSIPCLNLCYSLIAGVEMIPCGYSSADSYYTLQGAWSVSGLSHAHVWVCAEKNTWILDCG